MFIFPAIDLKEGKVVRLLQGRMEAATIYDEHPAEVAEEFARQGATHLHVVDLDGAFAGEPVNDAAIREIVRAVPLQVQVGGGIRSLARIGELVELGVKRVILGTAAVTDRGLVEEAVRRYGESILVGIDAREGRVAVKGWAENTAVQAVQLGLDMKSLGVKRIVFTDISRDGMLQGPNIRNTVQLAQTTGLRVIASGGISRLEDLRCLAQEEARGAGIEGAIIGKALYAGNFTLREALEALRV
ncbi:1-(5-phosphoribosyl)-5-[(5-phosphoribosylamino)methylideneamino]imidazole-4-carboxamide isomerase [Acididesulfobacillus acetoxydans]|uniref:1-(5-phosphoribosyl)-5-[(5-phosphoribosylamino)methylideneamino] imidazole-4-carboxamide isomerase n=1 Tax=Acididesulfobacillus acetoxydans TaxID=1561005 RepID=A0A8S0XCF9_9FIRM|nr:1-(5-phosphoribosyl)-5-[(5-phosphoribosylamino)methylideneamino]imidazole-4-carboxamide isomerase [Acididesulfobacillus acetoxydans]CAA7602406.1 1-(5-phosphoribosyl)-5-[(5-phosphoribosylamino)methylideneamino]imidazole-4-carboxamide isomerase [Acididesulfobacillus acetoxydans]CEJ08359.1 1-(5-phosphoribosyl)-5-[(5-phosphoribosylamino)methylideneamino] imidazole-4-carboxamide isomerase [Acididesulfobacillus acetoxydans]